MAMNAEAGGAAPPPTRPSGGSPGSAEGAPGWVVPLYVGGLVVLYLGERVLSTFDSGHLLVSGLGVACVLAGTVARFVPTWQAGGERGKIERLLGILSVVGVVALCFYAVTTDWGMSQLARHMTADQRRDHVHDILTIVWVVLIAISVLPMLFAEAALYPMRNAERLESRRVRAAASAGLTIALALVYGGLFLYSADSSEAKVDFSYFKTSEPSASTLKIVQGLNEPIRVVAFFPDVNPVRNEVVGYLSALAAKAKNLKYEIHDRYLVPSLAKEMKIMQDGVIVIVKGNVLRTVNVGTDMKEAEKALKTLDRDFQERLYKLLRDRRSIYMTVGHGEINDDTGQNKAQAEGRSAQILRMLLGKQNYTLKNLGLGQGLASDVPDDADIVMVLGPSEPFTPEEIASLDRYRKRGGKLFLALDPDAISTEEAEVEATALVSAKRAMATPKAGAKGKPSPEGSAKPGESAAPAGSSGAPGAKPNEKGSVVQTSLAAKSEAEPELGQGTTATLKALAAIVGLEFSPVVLANDKQFARRRFNDADHTLLVTNRFSSHPSVTTLSRNAGRAAIFIGGAGSLTKAPSAPPTEKVDIAIRAPQNTFGDINRNYLYDEGLEKRDSFGIAAAVSEGGPAPEKKPDDKKKVDVPSVPMPNEMRAFVIADADAISDLALSNAMTNQLLVVDALRWLGGEESFAGEVNNEEDVRIEHTQHKDLVWFYSTIFGAPALVLGLGLTYSRRSRQARKGGK